MKQIYNQSCYKPPVKHVTSSRTKYSYYHMTSQSWNDW